jgi:hypothetical protein
MFPLQINVIQIVLSLIASWVSDALPKARRYPIMAFAALAGVALCTALAATPVYPEVRAQRWALYCETVFLNAGRIDALKSSGQLYLAHRFDALSWVVGRGMLDYGQ